MCLRLPCAALLSGAAASSFTRRRLGLRRLLGLARLPLPNPFRGALLAFSQQPHGFGEDLLVDRWALRVDFR